MTRNARRRLIAYLGVIPALALAYAAVTAETWGGSTLCIGGDAFVVLNPFTPRDDAWGQKDIVHEETHVAQIDAMGCGEHWRRALTDGAAHSLALEPQAKCNELVYYQSQHSMRDSAVVDIAVDHLMHYRQIAPLGEDRVRDEFLRVCSDRLQETRYGPDERS